MQRGQFTQQQGNKGTICRPSVVNAQSFIGSEKIPVAEKKWN